MDPDDTAMASRDRLGNGKSYASASMLTAAGRIEPMEPLKDLLLCLQRDAWSAVANGQIDLSAARPQFYFYSSASWAVLQGVAEQVDQQSAQFRLHPKHVRVGNLNR